MPEVETPETTPDTNVILHKDYDYYRVQIGNYEILVSGVKGDSLKQVDPNDSSWLERIQKTFQVIAEADPEVVPYNNELTIMPNKAGGLSLGFFMNKNDTVCCPLKPLAEIDRNLAWHSTR